MGSAQLSCASLSALCAAPDFQVVGVVTQPDRPKGRKLEVQAPPVKELARSAGLPVLQPERARSPDFIRALRELKPELIVVAAYGQILPQEIIDLPRFGCVNVHTSLLPKYRGAAPIQWAILKDEAETGVTIMKMDPGLDTGPILTQEKTSIRPADTAETLHERLAQIGANLLVRTIPDYVTGKIQPQPQPSEAATYAPKIKKQDGEMDWSEPARALWNRVRGLVLWPGAFTFLPTLGAGGWAGKADTDAPSHPHPRSLLKIWESEVVHESGAGVPGVVLRADKSGVIVACGQQALRLVLVQREGGRRLTAQEFLAGHPLSPGQRLG